MSRDLILVSLSLLVWGLGEGMFAIFQPLYLQQFGADPRMIGGILGAMGLAMAAAQAPAGYLADRIGSRPLMRVAWVVGVLAAGIMAFAASLPWFVVGLLIYGLTAFVSAPMNSYVADVRGRWGVGRALTLTQASYNLGAVAGPAVGGWIGDHFGLQSIYLVSFFVFILSTLVVIRIRPQPKNQHNLAASLPRLHQNSRFLALLPFFFLTTLTTYLPQTLTPNYLQNQQGLDFSQIGQLGSLGSLGIVVMMLALGSLAPWIGLLVGQIFVNLFALLLWHGSGFIGFAIGYLFIGGYRLSRLMILAYTRPVVPIGQTGTAFGLIELVNGTALFMAPILGGWLYSNQPASLYTCSLLAGIGAFLLNLVFLPAVHRTAASNSIIAPRQEKLN